MDSQNNSEKSSKEEGEGSQKSNSSAIFNIDNKNEIEGNELSKELLSCESQKSKGKETEIKDDPLVPSYEKVEINEKNVHYFGGNFILFIIFYFIYRGNERL